jgi:hypothetical protein
MPTPSSLKPKIVLRPFAVPATGGLIERHPNPGDKRRILIELTDEGREALEQDRRNREGWLARGISESLSPEEQATPGACGRAAGPPDSGLRRATRLRGTAPRGGQITKRRAGSNLDRDLSPQTQMPSEAYGNICSVQRVPLEVEMDSELGSMGLERLEREIGELAAHIHAATCRWLLLVAEFDRREGWANWGAKSCADWLSWRCGVAPRAAREQARVARRLADLPLTREAFGRGELSYSKVRAISRVASVNTEPQLVMTAQHVTAAQLERLVRVYRGVVSTQVERANRIHAERYVAWEWEEDGSLSLNACLSAEDGALVVKALEAARDGLRDRGRDDREDGSAKPPAAPSNADALASMAETLLAHGSSERAGGDRYQLVVHAEPQALRDDAPDACCELENGPALPAETARRLACDASLVAITERDGRPLSVGRKTRTIPPALRRALRSRDGGCCFPGCDQRRFVDAHHLQHWAHGGETKLSNLLLLCRRHHRLVHEGGFGVSRAPGGAAAFTCPDGRAIPPIPRNRPGSRTELRRLNHHADLEITMETPVARSGGERIDYDLAIEGLLHSEGWLGLERPAHMDAESCQGSAERKVSEEALLS